MRRCGRGNETQRDKETKRQRLVLSVAEVNRDSFFFSVSLPLCSSVFFSLCVLCVLCDLPTGVGLLTKEGWTHENETNDASRLVKYQRETTPTPLKVTSRFRPQNAPN